jgi:hypothetical protein
MSIIGCAGSEEPGPNYDSTSHNHTKGGKPVKIVEPARPRVAVAVMRESLRAAAPGAAGREVPMPVPKKSEQPSEDIRQQKPLVRLQQKVASRHEREGGPGSGRKPGGGKGSYPKDTQGRIKVPGGMTANDRAKARAPEPDFGKSQPTGGSPEAMDAEINDLFRKKEKLEGEGKRDTPEHREVLNTLLTKTRQRIGGGGASAQGIGAEHQKRIQQQNEKMPGPMRDIMNPREPRSTEAKRWPRRRSLRRSRPIWEDDSERDRSDSGLTA